MPVSQGNFSSGPEGLQLVAWALMKKDGTFVRQSGFSGQTHGVGQFNLTFSQARASANYMIVCRSVWDANYGFPGSFSTVLSAPTTAGFTAITYGSGGAPADVGMLHVAVYE